MPDRDPLKPPASLLCKLGSIVVHADEMMSPKGHAFDATALKTILADPEVIEWLAAMNEMALLPVRR